MKKSDSITNLIRALVAAQPDIAGAELDSENPHFKSKYASLGSVQKACKEALKKNGLFVTQTSESDDVANYLETTLMHTSGEWISGRMKLLVDQPNMQKLGSAWTYARRYSLAALVGIVEAEDDDGNVASYAPPTQRAPQGQVTTVLLSNQTTGNHAKDNPGSVLVPFGRNKGRPIFHVSATELEADLAYWETRARNDGKPLTGKPAEYVTAVRAFLDHKGPKTTTHEIPPMPDGPTYPVDELDVPPF